MPKSLPLRSTPRPPRVKLAGTILALVRMENSRQVTAKLHQLSVTGGLLHLPAPLDEGIRVEIIFHVPVGTVRNQATILFPMWATNGYLQPFEFLELADENQKTVSNYLETLLSSGAVAVVDDSQDGLAGEASAGV